MALLVGSVVEGKVTGLTKFGAFVELPEGKVGMVHISEVASTYVKEISDFLQEGQEVKVKVLNIDEAGKISLSIKKAEDKPERAERPQRNNNNFSGENRQGDGGYKRRERRRDPNVWTGQKEPQNNDNLSFEEMMNKFKQVSDEKMSDLKRSSESKHGSAGFSRRGGNRGHR